MPDVRIFWVGGLIGGLALACSPTASTPGGGGATSASTRRGGGSSSGRAGGGGSSGAFSASTGSGSGSSGGSGSLAAGCDAGSACQPANPCDNGALDCSTGLCQDLGTADPARTGAICALDAICWTGQCLSSQWPLVPNRGGGVIAAPNLVLLTYADDPNQPVLGQYGAWLADGGYLPLVAGEYGVGNGSAQLVDLGSSAAAPTGTTSDPSALPDYLQSLLDSQAIPGNAPGNLYLLFLPSSWPDTAAFCQVWEGFHASTQRGGVPLIYAILPNCLGTQAGFLQQLERATAHEVVEAATDPRNGSWQIDDPQNPYGYQGGEVADLCSSFSVSFSELDGVSTYTAPLIWSDAALAAGEVPCQPWPTGQTYVSLQAPQTMAVALPGTSAQVTVTGWASGPSASFSLLAQDVGHYADFATSPQLGSATLSPGAQATVTLSVPPTAIGGQHGAASIVAWDSTTGQALGAALVGVTAGCASSLDCGDPTTVCYGDGGASGYCAANGCGSGNGTLDGLCDAAGTNDGTCAPAGDGGHVCVQGGAATGGCDPDATRQTPATLCVAGDVCLTLADAGPACQKACQPAEGVGGCPSGTTCVPFTGDPGDGVCLSGCTSLTVSCGSGFCPTGSLCSGAGLCICPSDTVALTCSGVPCGSSCSGAWWCAPRAPGACGAVNFDVPCGADGGGWCPSNSVCENGGCVCNRGFEPQSCAGVPCTDGAGCSYPDWWCVGADGG